MHVHHKHILWCAGLLGLVSSQGCHTTGGPTGLVPPLVNVTAAPRAGEKERDLPAAETAKLCFITAESLERGGKDAEAIALFEKARSLDARLGAEATRHLAALHDRSGQFDRALDEYRRGLQENPKDAKLLNDLGYGYYCRGEWAAAEVNLRKAITADPKFANAWNNLGMALAQQGKYDESLSAFAKAVTQAQAYCNLAFILATQSKIDEAKQQYQMALQLEPGLQIARVALQKLNHRSPQAVPATSRAEPTPALHGGESMLSDATGLPLSSNP